MCRTVVLRRSRAAPVSDRLCRQSIHPTPPWRGRTRESRFMSVSIKTAEDIAGMRVAGRLAAEVLEMIEEYVTPGVTTDELNRICHDYIVNVQTAIPAPLKNGDAMNIDVTVIKDGYFGDTSKMFHVGEVPEWVERLSRVTQECLYKGISVVRPGARLGDIGQIIQDHAHANRYSVVRDYC